MSADYSTLSLLLTVARARMIWIALIVPFRSNERTGQTLGVKAARARYKMNARRCETELYKLKDQVLNEFKQGMIDEENYTVLDRRINEYLNEIREERENR